MGRQAVGARVSSVTRKLDGRTAAGAGALAPPRVGVPAGGGCRRLIRSDQTET